MFLCIGDSSITLGNLKHLYKCLTILGKVVKSCLLCRSLEGKDNLRSCIEVVLRSNLRLSDLIRDYDLEDIAVLHKQMTKIISRDTQNIEHRLILVKHLHRLLEQIAQLSTQSTLPLCIVTDDKHLVSSALNRLLTIFRERMELAAAHKHKEQQRKCYDF